MTQFTFVFSEKSPAKPDTPPSLDERHQPNLTIQTTFGSSPSTIVGSERSPETEKDLEKQSPGAAARIPWPWRVLRIIVNIGRSKGVQLTAKSTRPCSEHGEIEPVIPLIRLQPDPRLKCTKSTQIENRIHHDSQFTVETLPRGYPRLAGFQASDEAFSIYRGFGYMHARVITDLQYDISDLEQRLFEIDNLDNCDDEGRRRLISRDNDDQDVEDNNDNACERRELMDQLHEKLVKYDEILLKAREIRSFQKPNQRDYTSVVNWFDNNKPLVEDEWYSLKQQDDMITLKQGREWAMFDSWIESILRKCDPIFPPIGWVFRPERLQEQSGDDTIFYYHSGRVEKLVAMIITAIIFILLVIPVVLMYKLTSLGNRSSTFDAIGVMVVFTLIFSAAMSLLTKAKRHELFGASAAYCAVLVVFISNFGGQSVGNK